MGKVRFMSFFTELFIPNGIVSAVGSEGFTSDSAVA